MEFPRRKSWVDRVPVAALRAGVAVAAAGEVGNEVGVTPFAERVPSLPVEAFFHGVTVEALTCEVPAVGVMPPSVFPPLTPLACRTAMSGRVVGRLLLGAAGVVPDVNAMADAVRPGTTVRRRSRVGGGCEVATGVPLPPAGTVETLWAPALPVVLDVTDEDVLPSVVACSETFRLGTTM